MTGEGSPPEPRDCTGRLLRGASTKLNLNRTITPKPRFFHYESYGEGLEREPEAGILTERQNCHAGDKIGDPPLQPHQNQIYPIYFPVLQSPFWHIFTALCHLWHTFTTSLVISNF